MALSSQTLDHLNDAESHLRAALKSASANENPTVISMISRVILEVDSIKKIEDMMDILKNNSSGGNNPFRML